MRVFLPISFSLNKYLTEIKKSPHIKLRQLMFLDSNHPLNISSCINSNSNSNTLFYLKTLR